VLVFLDAKQPIKYPLYKKVMTIGRAEDADIQINGDFVSRVHARLLCTDTGVTIEDVDSKNGIKVNSKLTERQTLRHGDVLGLGRLRFTFIDTAEAD
jgi:pSer/pThr/pTyr-binding forkhead associated (FHA) protein